MAHVEHVLAVVPVRVIETGRAWYSRLFGRAPDNNPMPNLVEWRVTDNGWVQVTEDASRAGHGLLNLAVSDLEEGVREVQQRASCPARSSSPTRMCDCVRSSIRTTT